GMRGAGGELGGRGAAETLGDETDFQTSAAKTMAETFDGQTPTPAPEGADSSGGAVSAGRVTLAGGGEPAGGGALPSERPQPDPAPLDGAQQRQEGQPPGVQQPEVATGQPLDQAEQEPLAPLDTGQGCLG